MSNMLFNTNVFNEEIKSYTDKRIEITIKILSQNINNISEKKLELLHQEKIRRKGNRSQIFSL